MILTSIMKKKTVVVHSGGMDSSICLALACRDLDPSEILSIGFIYGQRHSVELDRARVIAKHFGVERIELSIDCLSEITESALIGNTIDIKHDQSSPANTMVVGRNGLMARIAAIHAQHLGADSIYMGVIEVESENSGYRDCSRLYMDRMQEILRMDFDCKDFEIKTPLVHLTKKETMELAHKLGVLEFLLEHTITCYNGTDKAGCMSCPACTLRNRGIAQFVETHKDIKFSYKDEIMEWYHAQK